MYIYTHMVCACSVAQLCPTLCDPIDYSPPGSSVHGIRQARILELVAISSSRESSQSRDQTCISCVPCIGRQILYHCTTWEAHIKGTYICMYICVYIYMKIVYIYKAYI